ncbi:MAG: DUF2723 domain-containing protein [Proteobacteria bacterium]|nr:DUF2723 domain-containing protein [Pseudomonadota bacterium]
MLRRPLDPQYALPFTLSILAFLLYIFTLSPSINFGDSPELVSAAYNLGIAHPPGYPLYSLVGRLFAFIPAGGDIAGRVNLLSAFFTATSVFILTLITTRLAGEKARLGAVFAVLVLALSPTIWSQAVVAEVYSLNLFAFSLLVFLLLRWRDGSDRRFLYAGAFICGLGMGNHHTLLSLIPMVFMAPFLGKERALKHARLYILMTLLFLLGMTVYIYLPLRSMQAPLIDWGDPETVERFFDVVLRRQFPASGGELSLASTFKHIGWYLKQLGREMGYPLLLVALFGKIKLFRRDTLSWALLTFLFIVNGLGTLFFLNPPQEAYEDVLVMLIPSFAITAIWVGMGASSIIAGIKNKAGAATVTALLAVAVIYPLPGSFKENNHRGDYYALDMAENIFKSIDRGAVVFVESDNSLFPLWYLQQVEGKRRDVAVIDVDFLMLPWFKGQMEKLYPGLEIPTEDLGQHSGSSSQASSFGNILDSYKAGQVEFLATSLISTRPLYLSYEFGPVYRQYNRSEHFVIEHGLLYRISPSASRPDFSILKGYELRSTMDRDIPRTPFIKAFSLAYLRAMQTQARIHAMEGRPGEAKRIIDRMKDIRKEAASLLK